MTTSVFPLLPGLGWSVHKKPTLSTRVASHASGREVRVGLYAHPLYEFELTFDGLDSSGDWVGLQANSLQTLMGFFLSAGGKLNSFAYYDPTDYLALDQSFGTGDGVAKTFTLSRPLGGFADPIGLPCNDAAPTPLPIAGQPYPPMNLIANSMMSGVMPGHPTGWNVAASGGLSVSYVDSGTDSSTGLPYIDIRYLGTAGAGAGGYIRPSGLGLIPAQDGDSYVASAYVAVVGGSLANVNDLRSDIGGWTGSKGTSGASEFFTPSSSLQRVSVAGSLATSQGATSVYSDVANFFATNGAAIDVTFRVAGPQLELCQPTTTTPGVFVPTSGNRNNGSPAITVGGSYIDPSNYSISGNRVTFNAAPASGAALVWTGAYAHNCRFLDDQWDFENFMNGIWTVKSVKFRSVR